MQQGLTEVTVRNVMEFTDKNAELTVKNDVELTTRNVAELTVRNDVELTTRNVAELTVRNDVELTTRNAELTVKKDVEFTDEVTCTRDGRWTCGVTEFDVTAREACTLGPWVGTTVHLYLGGASSPPSGTL